MLIEREYLVWRPDTWYTSLAVQGQGRREVVLSSSADAFVTYPFGVC